MFLTNPNISRLCLHCGDKENEHPAGQCLFQSTTFEPHQLSGQKAVGSLFDPVRLDVVVDDTACEYYRREQSIVRAEDELTLDTHTTRKLFRKDQDDDKQED